MEKKVRQIAYISYNIIRLAVGFSFLLFSLTDLYNINIDADTYEKVYTGEFLGEHSYESLSQLKLSRWIEAFFSISYLIFVVLHLTILKRNRVLIWALRFIDVFIVIFFIRLIFVRLF